MADIKDISTVVASALDEISVPGTLDVKMDGEEVVEPLAAPAGEAVKIVVTVVSTDDQADVD